MRHAPGDLPLVDACIEFTRVFALSDGSCIDGSARGNATAYLNHSCGPNCEAIEEWDAGGELDLSTPSGHSVVGPRFPKLTFTSAGRPVVAFVQFRLSLANLTRPKQSLR